MPKAGAPLDPTTTHKIRINDDSLKVPSSLSQRADFKYKLPVLISLEKQEYFQATMQTDLMDLLENNKKTQLPWKTYNLLTSVS